MDDTTPREWPNAATQLPHPMLPIGRYRLEFEACEPVRLPEYAGSAWRGAFGHALKRLVCVTREPVCAHCLLYRSCLYPYIFETPPDPSVGKLRKYTAAPHPFVLVPETITRRVIQPGATVRLGLTVFGHGNRHLPYLVHALDKAGQRGIGQRSGRLTLRQVEQAEPGAADWQLIWTPGETFLPRPITATPIPPCPERLTLILETPLRLKSEDHYLTPERFRFGSLFANLLRRISLLTTFHTDTPLETDFASLTRAARTIEVDSAQLCWHDWTRYSSRQSTLMQMGGLLGSVTLRGEGLTLFWPYLWLGQWTHAGKATSMGLGRYRIAATDKLVTADMA